MLNPRAKQMLTRRQSLMLIAAAIATRADTALARDIVELSWSDLVPEGDTGRLLAELARKGRIEHGELTTGFDQVEARAVTEAYNGKTVRIPGFGVPLDFSAKGTTSFLLVPFVGACIHVPPPPANQLVFVTTDRPYIFSGLDEAVQVTGTFNTALTGTELADVGYTLEAERIRSF